MVAPRKRFPATSSFAAGPLGDLRRFVATPVGKACAAIALLLLALVVFEKEDPQDAVYLRETVLEAAGVHAHSKPVKALDVDFVPGSAILLNIGSNVDPIVPRLTDDPCTAAIAFEPVAYDQVPPHPGLLMVPAAVSDEASWAAMHIHNSYGVSSSLADPNVKIWDDHPEEGKVMVVPILDFYDLMRSLQAPPLANPLGIAQGKYRVQFLKSDMQGFDFQAFSAVPPQMWKNEFPVPYLMTEAYLDGVVSYAGVKNDLCWDWLPYMKEAGYIFEGVWIEDASKRNRPDLSSWTALEAKCRQQGTHRTPAKEILNEVREANVYWRHPSMPPTPKDQLDKIYTYPTHGPWGEGPKFEPGQYAACKGQKAPPPVQNKKSSKPRKA